MSAAERLGWRPEDLTFLDPQAKALARPRDGDGDCFVEDGTPRMRPVPVRAALPHEDAVAAGAARVARHRAEARRYDGPQVGDFDWQTARDTLGQVYATTFNTSTGRRVTSVGAVHVDVVEDDDGGVAGYAIYGELFDLDTDQTVGVFDRFIGRDGTAFHNGFTVYEPGEGIASEFNAHAVAWYRQIGVDRIGVNATGTLHQTTRPPEDRPGQVSNPVSEAISRSVRRAYNGGYTWGQQGFVFADGAFDNTLIGRVWAIRHAASVLRGFADDQTAEIVAPAIRNLLDQALPDDWWDDDVQRAILADLLDSIDPESITPYELNGVGRGMPFVDRDTGEDTWLGRALMSRSSWLGYFDLWWLDIYPETKGRGLDATRRRMLVDLFLAALGDDADTMETKARRGFREPRDGDGDGFIYDSTPRMRRVTPLSGARWRRAVEAARAAEPRPATADRDGTAVAASRPDPNPAPVLSAVPQMAVLEAFTIANRVNADRIAQGGGDPGILDRLIRAAEAYDAAVHLGEGIAAALSRLLDVLQRIADLRTPGGRYLLDQDDLGDGYRRLAGLSYSDPLPEAKAVYSGGVGKTLHRGTTPRDGDGDGFIDDGKPTQRPAPNRLAQVAAAASRAGTAAAAAAARRTPEPTTSWRRAIGGYMHPTGDYFLERQAPMAGGRTNWWAIHQRVPPERVGRDRPDSTIAYDTENGQVLTQIDGVDWYAHVGDEGSLADAKYAVDRLRGVPDPVADHRGEGYRQARDRFGNASREDRERVLGKVEQMLPTTEGTQRESMEGIRDFLADSLEADAPPTVPDEADDLGGVHVGPGRVGGTGTADDPIDVQGDLTRAARLIADGKHVRLNRVDEIGTLVEKLAALVREAADRGEKAPTYDLCKVSVPGTNLFCKQSKGIPRLQMPQLSGKPLPGSKSDALPRNPRGNVNVKDLFVETLQARGIGVEKTTLPAAAMKATQNELDGPAVGRIYTTLRGGGHGGSGTLVTRDGYILDGHHQWAAQIAVDADNGLLGDQMVTVRMVDLEIGEAIETARAFSAAYGITPAGIGVADTARGPDEGSAWAAAERMQREAVRSPDFGKRVGAPVKRPMPGGGFVLVEKIGTRTPGQTIERVIWRVERRDGVWGVYPPPEQSPAVFMTGNKREAERWAVDHDDGRVPEDEP